MSAPCSSLRRHWGFFLLAFAVVYGSVVQNRAKAQEMVARDRR